MAHSDDDRLLEHEYDGIQEYDNPLPGWWTGIFILTIVFSPFYFAFYHGGGVGLSLDEAYMAELKEAAGKYGTGAGDGVDEAVLSQAQGDGTVMGTGRELFNKTCAACHKADGSGLVGPNLTDDFQKHGSTRADIYRVIRDGVPEKGMIAWGKTLKPDQLIAAAVFVASLRHTNVAGGKAAEGEKVSPLK